MRKILIIAILVLLWVNTLVNAQPYQIGISVGKDFYAIPNMSVGFNLQDLTEAELSRTGFQNPLSLGINFGYNPNKKYSIIIDADFNYLEYDVVYTRNVPELFNPGNIEITDYKIPWARFATMLSLNYIPYSVGGFDFFVGGGLGFQVFAPAVSDKFILETLLDKLSQLNISTEIDLNYSFSQKINVGIKYNIDSSNFNVAITTSYVFVNNAVYEAPNKFLTMKLFVNYLM